MSYDSRHYTEFSAYFKEILPHRDYWDKQIHMHTTEEILLFTQPGTCRMIKPDSAIYHHMLTECGIKAEETIFIDDSAVNVEAAIACGIHGYHYTGDANALRAHLAEILSLPELL